MRAPLRRNAKVLCQFSATLLISMVSITTLLAEVKYDGSFGRSDVANSTLQGGTTHFQIRAEDGFHNDPNLFHSFEKFDLSSSEAATFFGPSTVRNILARVTGGSASSINGKIASDISGANLFLMNPKGILFGPNAAVDVSGSFFATTADYIKLGNDGRFAATTNPADSILTVSEPSAFGFLTPNPAAIRVQGSTLGGAGLKTLGLIGGDVVVEGGATLEAQDVQLLAVRSTGEAALRLPGDNDIHPRSAIDAESFATYGSVAVGNPTVPEESPPTASINAKRVVIRGGTLAVKNTNVFTEAVLPGDGVTLKASEALSVGDQSILFSINSGDVRGQPAIDIAARSATIDGGVAIFSFTDETGAGGDIRLKIDGTLSITESSLSMVSASLERAGDILVTAGSLDLDNSIISSESAVGTKNGDIYLEVAGPLSITNGSSVLLSVDQSTSDRMVVKAQDITISGPGTGLMFLDQSAEGIGGAIEVAASGRLSILNGGQISATAVGRAGASISISAQNVHISGSGASPGSTGILAETTAGLGTRGGDIRMDVANLLEVLDGGAIASNTLSQGTGGDIVIRSHDVVVTGPGASATLNAFAPHGITAQNLVLIRGVESGSSGSVRLSLSGRLDVRDGGVIAVDTAGTGQGGSIAVAAESMSVASGGVVTARTLATEGGGRGGDIDIITTTQLEVLAGGQITVATLGSGTGGSLSIRSDEVTLHGRDALVSAVSGSAASPATGAGGNILVQAGVVQINDGALLNAGTHGAGAGGNILVQADDVEISGGGRINAGTQGSGAGGNVDVFTDLLRISSSSEFAGISAQTAGLSGGGAGGAVRIDAQDISLIGGGATITTQSFGSGNAGRIVISTDTLDMRKNSSIQSSAAGAGNAGAITIDADGNVTLREDSAISVDSAQSNAGDIRLRSGTSLVLTDSQITAQAALNGGNIDLRATDLLRLTNSQITAAAGVNGGNIFIDPIFVIFDRSLVSANAVLGRGGNIRIISDFFFSTNSAVTATSQLGIDGRVEIDALNNDLTGSLVELPSTLINAESLLQELCTVKVANYSSFISEGRGGLPPLPGEALPSLMIVP
jgi:filamentous hemagglutinin family protein